MTLYIYMYVYYIYKMYMQYTLLRNTLIIDICNTLNILHDQILSHIVIF